MAFVKGQSGNPGGRPKQEMEVIQLARQAAPDAIRRLMHWMNEGDARASIAASTALLDRAFGKPTQPVAGDPDRPPLDMGVTIDASKLSDEQLRVLSGIPVQRG